MYTFMYMITGSSISWNGLRRLSNSTSWEDIFACSRSLSLYKSWFPVLARSRRARFRRIVWADVSGRKKKRIMKVKEHNQRSSKMGHRQSLNSAAKPPMTGPSTAKGRKSQW